VLIDVKKVYNIRQLKGVGSMYKHEVRYFAPERGVTTENQYQFLQELVSEGWEVVSIVPNMSSSFSDGYGNEPGIGSAGLDGLWFYLKKPVLADQKLQDFIEQQKTEMSYIKEIELSERVVHQLDVVVTVNGRDSDQDRDIFQKLTEIYEIAGEDVEVDFHLNHLP
jgi:hypothetical protein